MHIFNVAFGKVLVASYVIIVQLEPLYIQQPRWI